MAKRIRRSASKFTQVATTRNVYAYTVDLQSSCVDLPLGCQTAKNLRRLAYEFEIDQSQRKASQVNASGWPNEMQDEKRKWKTYVELRRIASPFGQGFSLANSSDDTNATV